MYIHIHIHIYTHNLAYLNCAVKSTSCTPGYQRSSHSTVAFKTWLSLRKIKEFINGKKISK